MLQTEDPACEDWGVTLQKDFGVFVSDVDHATRLILEDVTSQSDQAIKFHGQDSTESHMINEPLTVTRGSVLSGSLSSWGDGEMGVHVGR